MIRSLFLLTIIGVFGITLHVHAVIPVLIGPIAALIALLPQILAFAGIGLLAVFKPQTYRTIIDRILKHKIFTTVIIVAIFAGIFGVLNILPKVTKVSVSETDLNGGQWLTFRGGVDRTGHLDQLPGPSSGDLLWKFSGTDATLIDFSSSPSIVGNRLYIGAGLGSLFGMSGAIYCIDLETRQKIWHAKTDAQVFSSPSIVGDRVYVGEGLHYDAMCHLRCFSAADGAEIWHFQTKSHIESTPLIDGDRVYFGAGEDGVYCISAETSDLIWHFPNAHVDISPIVVDGKAFFGSGYGDLKIFAVSAKNGSEIQTKKVDLPVWGTPTINAKKDLIYFGLGNGNFVKSDENPRGAVIAFKIETLDQVWRFDISDAVLTAIAFSENVIYFGCRNGNVYAINSENGEEIWRSEIGTPIVSSPAVTTDQIYCAGTNGVIYAIDRKSGDLEWWFSSDDVARNLKFYSSPAIANGKLYIGSSDRYILCLGD